MTGAKDLMRTFSRLTSGLNAPINAASRKALRPMLAAAKANTPHRSVKKPLVIRRDPASRADRPTHVVGGDAKNPGYRLLHLLEFGTVPHLINGWLHPGTRAQPFLRPAFEETKDEVVEILGREIGPALIKQAAKVAKKRAAK